MVPGLCGMKYFLFFFSTGAVSAHNIMLVKKKPMRCQGVVCATKVCVKGFVHAHLSEILVILQESCFCPVNYTF